MDSSAREQEAAAAVQLEAIVQGRLGHRSVEGLPLVAWRPRGDRVGRKGLRGDVREVATRETSAGNAAEVDEVAVAHMGMAHPPRRLEVNKRRRDTGPRW